VEISCFIPEAAFAKRTEESYTETDQLRKAQALYWVGEWKD